jgi:hypothetical protein
MMFLTYVAFEIIVAISIGINLLPFSCSKLQKILTLLVVYYLTLALVLS